MSDPRVIALDVETYGAATHTHDGRALPTQEEIPKPSNGRWTPQQSLFYDVPLADLVLTCSITIPTQDPRNASSPWSQALLASLRPAWTTTFHLWNEAHRRMLRNWLIHVDTIIGMNIQFDILYLRSYPDFRYVLDGLHHTLIDLSVCNFLHSDVRPERSLKAIGTLLGTHVYKRTLKDGRFPSPIDPDYLKYAESDPHNTLLDVATLASLIPSAYPHGPIPP